jgi:hypothetical protein
MSHHHWQPAWLAPGATVIALILLLVAKTAQGSDVSIADLVDAGRLEINASLDPAQNIVPGQQVTLNLVIATDRWFGGGTRIILPEVPGLVILQTEQFASNASERRGNQSWVIQRWTLDVYPQKAGEFTIPPVQARLQVNAGSDQDVEGTIASAPLGLAVTVPAALADIPQWVAAPDFSVQQRFDRDLDTLQVGDAFERVVEFSATDLMAMMLPSLSATKTPGLAAYPYPPVLDNSNNRGESRATRTERISYVVEAEGRYQLPVLDFYWWNTARNRLEVLSLEAIEFSVGATAVAATQDKGFEVSRRQLLTGGGGLLLCALMVWLALRYLPRLPAERLHQTCAALLQRLRDLRKPALPQRLNPGGNAGE